MSRNPSTSNKHKFKRFSEVNPLPVYVQDWYLDLVCGTANWDVCVVERGNDVAAVLPYYLKSNKFFRWITMPPLSKLHGPYITARYQHPDYHHRIIEELLEQLPEVDYYQQGLNYSFKNWLPYLWQGFSQVTLYSYIFKSIQLVRILDNMDSDCRRRIKRADGNFEFRTNLDVHRFFGLLEKTFKRQNLPAPFSKEFMLKYISTILEHNAGQLLSIQDNDGRVHCAALIVWDTSCAYYLLEATDYDLPNKDAGIYMKWTAIRYAKQTLNIDRFDFEGSISRRIEKIYREFGAEAEQYFVIKKYYSKRFLFSKFMQNYKQYGKLVQW